MSLDQRIIEEWGSPKYQQREFDPEHAVSHRTWLAIASFVAYHEPKQLDLLFQGIEFLEKSPQQELDSVLFPRGVEEAISPITRQKYAHLKLTPRLFGNMETRLQLFGNLIEAMGATANFLVGRNIRVNRDIGALEAAFITSAKGLFKIIKKNPGEVLKKHVPDANRALNTFLETEIVNVGPDYMDLRVEYVRPEDVSKEGDHYTLGVVLGGLEAIGAYKKITIQALQTPLPEADEALKASITQPGVEYHYKGYIRREDSPVFLYRYYYQEPARFLRRVGRALQDFSRRNLPSVMKRGELQNIRTARLLTAGEAERDALALKEAMARAEAERARADAAEAKLTLEQQVSDVNRVFSDIQQLAHDNKNHVLELQAATVGYFRTLLETHSSYDPEHLEVIFQSDETLTTVLEGIIEDHKTPSFIRRGAEFTRLVHSSAEYTRGALHKFALIVENERAIMRGGMPITIVPVSYSTLIPSLIMDLRKVYPNVRIEYNPLVDFEVQGDVRLLKAAFTNLISNAVEASLPKGKVEIKAAQKTRGGRTFSVIDIYQSGLLPEDIAGKLNQGIKFTTKENGNGVGATASYNILTGPHHGSVSYVSLGEEGGRVEIRF